MSGFACITLNELFICLVQLISTLGIVFGLLNRALTNICWLSSISISQSEAVSCLIGFLAWLSLQSSESVLQADFISTLFHSCCCLGLSYVSVVLTDVSILVGGALCSPWGLFNLRERQGHRAFGL